MRDGKRADIENRLSLSPVTISSSSDHSKHSSASPPKIIGSLPKSIDGTVRLSQERRHFQYHSSDLRRPRNVYHARKYRSRSRSRDKSPQNRYRSRSRSHSLPKQYRSRSRSRGRGNRNRRSWSRSKSFRSRWSRSQSQRKHRRSRSRSISRAKRNRRSRSRSLSPYSNASSRRLIKSRSRSRSRARSRRNYRSKSPSHKSSHCGESLDMRNTWETFQAELSALESIRAEEERLYDKDPEKHPDYKMEWKKFYKSLVQEILDSGGDPKLHNFESEWAYFWKFRMSELINIDYEKKKVALKRRLKLPDDAEIPLYLQDGESKNSLLGSGMPPSHAGSLQSSKRIRNNKGLIFTLRIVTAVEEHLGSLGPRVIGLLSEAVALQRISGSDPDSLLSNPENVVLLETVKEKLLGQIQSNIVKKTLEGAVREAINSIYVLLKSSAPPNPSFSHNQVFPSNNRGFWPLGSTNGNQVNVPGVGQVDRIEIAQQIADALIKQGKTDVTEAELQELVNGVVGMVEAQAAQEKGMASLKERLQIQESVRAGALLQIHEDKVQEKSISNTVSDMNPVTSTETPESPDPPAFTKNPLSVPNESDALNMLMSVVMSGTKKTDLIDKSHNWSSDDSNEPLVINKTPVTLKNDKNPESESEKQDKEEQFNLKMEVNRTIEALKGTPSSEIPGISIVFPQKETPKWYSQTRKSPSPEIFKSRKKKVTAAKSINERKAIIHNKNLSPFSSREETSNPLPNSEEDEDLKVIGAWDSDSDIDLDSFGKTKGLAYDKVNVKRLSPDKYEKNLLLLNKSKKVLQNTVVVPPGSVSTDNLDAAIDNLMGELKNKTYKIEVISSKPQEIANKLQNISSTAKNVDQPSKNEQPMPSQTQQFPPNKVVATQGYNVPYCYPQPQMYGLVQQGYYNISSVPGYIQSGGVPYYGNNQGTASSTYYSHSGNLVYHPTNAQWPGYYSSQQANIPPNLGSGTNFEKY